MKTKIAVTVTILVFAISQILAQGNGSKQTINKADSLFAASNWKAAAAAYKSVFSADPSQITAVNLNKLGFSYHSLNNTTEAMVYYEKALTLEPNAFVKSLVLARMARIYAVTKRQSEALTALEESANLGYRNLTELESHTDFSTIRADDRFVKAKEKVRATVFPCLYNKQAREFDFWVGEWDAYQRGTTNLAGYSKIEIASGGCMILENWTSKAPGASFEGKSINYVDPASGKWKQVWVGSGTMPNVGEFTNGEYRDGAMRFEFESTNQQGQKILTHFHFYNGGPNQVRQLFKTSTDNGETWTVGYDFTYVRRK